MKYQIYSVIKSESGSYEGGCSVHQIVLKFDTQKEADIAFERLKELDTGDIGTRSMVRLYEREGDVS